MKILCEFTPCGPSFVRSGWGRVFQACGHEFRFWSPDQEPAFDAFAWEPDLFIGTTYGVDRAVYKNIVKRPEMRVALYASAWGPLTDSVDREKYPIVIASENEKRIIENLKKETGRPDFVFIHVTNKYLDPTMSGWRDIGVTPAGILNAADIFVYTRGVARPELACDVGFVGGYWGYKARNIDQYLLPLCGSPNRLNVKIFGNQPWPVHQYLGTCSDEDARDLFVSATVCPSVSEPHSTDLGFDIIERPFKVIAAGGVCVSDNVDEMNEIFTPMELMRADNPKYFRQLIRAIAAGEMPERKEYVALGQKKVFGGHTYHDRVSQMFGMLGMLSEQERVMANKKGVLDALRI